MGRQLLVVALLMSSNLAVRADVVFSNLGPSDSFAPLSSFWLTGPDTNMAGLQPGNFDVAAAFTVNQPQSFTLDTVELPLRYLDGVNSSVVRLFTDDAGFPGIELASTSISGIPTSATLLTADFHASPISLSAGASYWLVSDVEQDTSVFWNFNNTGQFGIAFRTTGAWVLEAGNQPAPAFRINGTLVPEPATLMMLILAAVGWCLRKRQAA